MTETSLCLRPSAEVNCRVGTHLVYTEEHVGSRLLHAACSNAPVMEQYLLQGHTASATITINAAVSYFPTLYCHREVFKNADITLENQYNGWNVLSWDNFLGLM